MKRIINNKVYDTDTARSLGEWHNIEDQESPEYISEALFRKKSGEFFLYCSGRRASVPFSSGSGQPVCALDEKILPLSFEQAAQWGQAHLPESAFSAAFGSADPADDRKTTVHISISSGLWDAAKKEASRRGIPVSSLVESLLSDCLS